MSEEKEVANPIEAGNKKSPEYMAKVAEAKTKKTATAKKGAKKATTKKPAAKKATTKKPAAKKPAAKKAKTERRPRAAEGTKYRVEHNGSRDGTQMAVFMKAAEGLKKFDRPTLVDKVKNKLEESNYASSFFSMAVGRGWFVEAR